MAPEAMPSIVEAPPRRGRARLGAFIAGGAVVIVVLAIVGGRLLRARHDSPVAAPSSASASAGPVSSETTPPPPSPTTSAPVAAAAESATENSSPSSSPSAAPSASVKPTTATKPFDGKRAGTALNALVPKLAACKLAKGSSWSVKVTFAPDGRVTSAVPAGKHAATQSTCVAAQLRKATIAPFAGGPTPYVFTFVAGSK